MDSQTLDDDTTTTDDEGDVVAAGLTAIVSGAVPPKEFTDKFGEVRGVRTTPDGDTQILLSNGGPHSSGTVKLSEWAEKDLTAGLTASSTPDADNPNHEWRDGKKYVRGTSIEVRETAEVKNASRLDSPWSHES